MTTVRFWPTADLTHSLQTLLFQPPTKRRASARPLLLDLLLRRFAAAAASLFLRSLFQPHRGEFVGVVAVLAADGVLGGAHLAVEALLGVADLVANDVEGDLGADQGGAVGHELFVGGGDGLEGDVGVVGGVALDGAEAMEGLDIFVDDLGRDAAAWGLGHACLLVRVDRVESGCHGNNNTPLAYRLQYIRIFYSAKPSPAAALRQAGSACLDVGCARPVVAPQGLVVESAGIRAARAWGAIGEA